MDLMKALIPLLKRYPFALLAVVSLGVAASLSEGIGISLFVPFLQSLDAGAPSVAGSNRILIFVNTLFASYSRETRLWLIPLCIFSSIVVRNALLYANTFAFSCINWRICHQLRCGIFKQLLTVATEFLERRKVGNLLHTLNGQTWQTSQALAALASLITSACTIAVFSVLLLLISWKLTLLIVVATTLVSWVVQLLTHCIRAAGARAAQANAAFVQQSVEGLSGMKVIRAFAREEYEQQRFEDVSGSARRAFMRLDWISGAVYPISEVLSTAVLVGVVMLAVHNRASLPILMTFIFMLYRLQPKIRILDSSRAGIASLLCDVQEVMTLLDPRDKPYIRSGARDFSEMTDEIVFERVSFTYNTTEVSSQSMEDDVSHPAGLRASAVPALRNVSIRIPCGKTTAIVGPSGAGKSTLVDLICRFHDPNSGRILIDGAPLTELNLKAWRNSIALLSQDAFVFNSSIRENIAFGKLGASDSQIIAAAEQANAHAFIRQLPQGYDTPVGDRGVRLSGGQRQRIALARAIIRDARIVILDEATNALDSITERLIQDALNAFSRDRTMIVIAHRLSTIERADQIIVMNEGEVVEHGALADVLRANGLFSRMYHLQHGVEGELVAHK